MSPKGMPAGAFVHPGTLFAPTELAQLPARSRRHPRALPQAQRFAPLTYAPQALPHVRLGSYGEGVGHKECTRDAEACYSHAVHYLIYRHEAPAQAQQHAQKAVDILRAWATTNQTFEGSNAPLETSWMLPPMVRTVELLKHTWLGWKAAQIEAPWTAWVERVVLPKVRSKITWTNNWSLTMAEARMQWAIFRDDRAEFDQMCAEFRRIFAIYVLPWKSGQCGETKRDIIHACFGIGSMINLCEMAWHQGVDLYRPELHACMEYHAGILLGEVPADLKPEEIKDNRFQPIGWEIGYQHYRRHKKMPMPKTQKLLEQNRPEKATFCWGLSTLTHFCI